MAHLTDMLRARSLRHLVAVAAFVAVSVWGGACDDPLSEALTLEEEGDFAGAVAVYQEIMADDPDDLEALKGAAGDLMLLGRYDEALVLQERVVELDAAEVLTRIDLGFNYLNHQERPADAARVLGEAARVDPSAKNLGFLAQALIVSGDPVGAEAALRAAIEADATYERPYGLLVELLTDQGRLNEAAEVADRAERQGIIITGSY